MQATRYIRHTRLMPSQASQLLQKSRFHTVRKTDTFKNVGAGLLANAVFQLMHWVTDTPHSRASPLPQLTACSFEYVLFYGSWLACDADTSVHQVHRVDAIAGKPAPTFDRVRLCCCCCSGPYILFDDEVSGLLICAFDLDLNRPVKHDGRNSTGIWGVNRQGCRFTPQIHVGLRACRA